MRASDADRQAVVDRLRGAHDDGRLTLHEFDERTAAAYTARTYADLLLLTADLPDATTPPAVPHAVPSPSLSPPTTGRQVDGTRRGTTMWRVVGSTWFAVSAVNLVIWGIISLALGDALYPWWIWVAGPWGAVLLVGWLSGLGRDRG
jgi:hypothetical protein